VVAVALLGVVAMGVAGWVVYCRVSRRSYAFRLGQRGLWIDYQFYHWHDLVAVTHYVDLGMLLIKVRRSDDVPLAFHVELEKTRYRRWDDRRLRTEFGRRMERLVWKSV
jgi:hypothetical protein